MTEPRIVRQAAADVPEADAASSLSSPRGGTKLAQVVELLRRDHGATLDELVAATGWLPQRRVLRLRGCAGAAMR